MLALASILALAQSTLVPEFVIDQSDGLVSPIGLTSIAGDDRLFVVEIGGQVRILRGGQLEPQPFLDVSAQLQSTFFTGLRAVAFHPAYDVNGFVYLWYDAPSTNGALVDMVLGRMTRSALDPDLVDAQSLVEILREPQQNLGHGGGDLAFGPDGMLYSLLGDGGEQGDPACNAQDGTSLMGCLMRIDVDAAFPYAVPTDNPFTSDPNIRDEVWHLGFRHPWKWSFDSGTGDLWIADVGQARIEEIDFVPAGVGGLNFGWKVMEGSLCYQTGNCPAGTPPCGDSAYTLPLHEYDHALGCSITGGYVYRGDEIPDMQGAYLYADYCSGRFWSLREQGGAATGIVERTAEFQPGGGRSITAPVTFGQDGRGELYVIDADGWEIYRIRRTNDFAVYCDALPNATGLPGTASASGSSSVLANDLVLAAAQLPAQQFGLFFYGAETDVRPLGGGVLCIGSGGSGLIRLPVLLATAAGTVSYDVDLSAFPWTTTVGGIAPGDTRMFQFWHRDPTASGYNFTSAVSVLFRP